LQRSLYKNPPRIILETRDIKDSEIETIHIRGDVYVSLCRSEGTGLAAYKAICHHNPVIITAYGGILTLKDFTRKRSTGLSQSWRILRVFLRRITDDV
jgi:hypothetical protein